MEPLREVKRTVTGDAARGEGEEFRLRARWPSVAQLEYVQKFATAGLLVLGVFLLLGYAIANPRGAVTVIAGAARNRVG